jgi:hypothetical protein
LIKTPTRKPVVLSAKSLTILVEPFDHLAHSPLFQSPINAMTNGKSEDDEAAALWAEESSSSGVKMSDSFLQRLIRRIIEHLQLQVQSVNIEVCGSNGSSVGLILQNLTRATLPSWHEKYHRRIAPPLNSCIRHCISQALDYTVMNLIRTNCIIPTSSPPSPLKQH